MATVNSFAPHSSKYFVYAQQKKETHIGLEKLENYIYIFILGELFIYSIHLTDTFI